MQYMNSEKYYNKTKRKYLYNIVHINNISSIMEKGILCYNLVKNISHESIAMNEVQLIRESIEVPNGLPLHQYANLYFTYHNPMLYKRKGEADSLCILAVSHRVLDIEGCVVSDQNAAKKYARFYEPTIGIEKIDFNKVFAQSWIYDNDLPSTWFHKAIKCAEVLVPNEIPYEYIVGVCVVSDKVKNKLENLGFDKKILVKPEIFYRKEA